MTGTIDLNADLGEDESTDGIGRDLAMMDIVSSCNIACGAHAGSPENMRKMLAAASSKNVCAGAHPSYPDRENFGRISMAIPMETLRDSLQSQLAAIEEAAAETKTPLHHLKPHGALYNDAQDDAPLAELLVKLAEKKNLALIGMSDSLIHDYAQKTGIPFIAEAFVDRRYGPEKRLVPRTEQGAVIADQATRSAQSLALATGKPIEAANGQSITVSAQTLCLHSDSDGALETAKAVRSELEKAGLTIKPAVS